MENLSARLLNYYSRQVMQNDHVFVNPRSTSSHGKFECEVILVIMNRMKGMICAQYCSCHMENVTDRSLQNATS